MIMGACAPFSPLLRDRSLPVEEVFRRVQERNMSIATLRGDGTITIESPEGSNRAGFELHLRKPDSLRVEINGPFGIRLATLMLSRSHYLFYSFPERRAISGTPDGTTFTSMFNLKLEFDEALHAFTGEFPPITTSDSLLRFDVEADQYRALYKNGEATKEYRIDGDRFVVTSYRLLDSSGQSILTAIASDIDPDRSAAMPMLIRVIFPKDRRSISVSYDDVSINEAVDCALTIPESSEIIHRR